MKAAPFRSSSAAAHVLRAARAAQSRWACTPLPERLAVIRRARRRLADRPEALANTVSLPWRSSHAETLTAEVLPLVAAGRFLEREAPRLLAPRGLGWRGRPWWLVGTRAEIRRDPLGVVLIIGPANYPLLLPGVQALQALVAGNAVLVKPAPGAEAPMHALAEELAGAGLPVGVLHVLSDRVEDAEAAIDAGVDKVVLTGSAATGRRVLQQLARHTTPAVVELSGCDAVVVQEDADLERAARAVAFGMTLNAGYTCIAPRRLYVHASREREFERRLVAALGARVAVTLPPGGGERLVRLLDDATRRGARIVCGTMPEDGRCAPILLADVAEDASLLASDVAAPVAAILRFEDEEEALRGVARCPFRLGASVFGSTVRAATLARRLDVGVVVVNDMIVPTADPRLPFGGRASSGFGVTRGADGLLELTAPKVIATRGGRSRPHFDPTGEADAPLFAAFIQAAHGSTPGRRLRAALQLVREARRRAASRSRPST
jgi:acyl-CoA reductase-like NAD-dependent aldehyde dehydrogenase